jgi:hypothetical protein
MIENVKTFFNWLEDAHHDKITVAAALSNYWRVLKEVTQKGGR